MRTIRTPLLCGLAAFAVVIVVVLSLKAASKSDRLSLEQLSSIRGGQSGGGCEESNEQTACVNPDGDQYDSGCVNCSSASGTKLWNQPEGTTADYGSPADPCNTFTSWAYANETYVLCTKPKMPNNLICANFVMDPCTWKVACNDGPLQQNMTCDSGLGATYTCINKQAVTVAAPPGSGFQLQTTWFSCRACTTGNNQGVKTTASIQLCQNP